MKQHKRLSALFDQCEQELRCAFAQTKADHAAIRRRLAIGEVLEPYCGLYTRTVYWQRLSPPEQCMHVIRALAIKHPAWVFAGIQSAIAHGFVVSYSALRDKKICIASTTQTHNHDHAALQRVYMPTVPVTTINGLRVTSQARTLLDCARMLPFQQALPVFDSAAQTIDLQSALSLSKSLRINSNSLNKLIEYADPLSENGGESYVRAMMIIKGFMVPQLQQEFSNPNNPKGPYRVDYLWRIADRTIVGEFDGMEKYVLHQEEQRRQSIRQRVYAEREREQHLRAQGVSSIIRLDYEDAVYPERLEAKLTYAGIPRRFQQ